MSINRREFLEKALGVTVASMAAPVVMPVLNAFGYNPNDPLATTITVDLTLPENAVLLNVGGSKQITFPGKGNIFVIRLTETEFASVSAICTHQGCTGTSMAYNKTSQQILCSCHGSRFNVEGTVINGPASSPLKKYFTQFDGATTLLISDNAFSTVQAAEESGVRLEQNYPNPFAGRTTIGFTLPEAASVTLTLHTIAGDEAAKLYSGTLGSGRTEIAFSSGALAAGTYIYRLNTPWGTISKKMMIE